MNLWTFSVFWLTIWVPSYAQESPPKRLVCYVRGKGFRDGFSFDKIPSTPCTHIIFSYARLNYQAVTDPIVYIDPADEDNVNSLQRFRNSTQPGLRTMIMIGGDDDGEQYSELTSSPQNRRSFIRSIVNLCRMYDFDGVDLHWTYPGKKKPEKLNYVGLAQELRKELDITGKVMEVSMIIPSARELIIPGFNLLFLNAVVDFFSLMAFNFTPDVPPSTYHHAPITLPPNSTIIDNNLLTMTRLYLRIGTVAQRLVLGIPLFGRLVNTDTSEIENEEVPFNQICHLVEDGEWMKKGTINTGPLLEKNNQLMSLDNITSVVQKATIVNELRLGGIAFWSMEMDDWNLTCPNSDAVNYGYLGRWPVMEAAYRVLETAPSIDNTPESNAGPVNSSSSSNPQRVPAAPATQRPAQKPMVFPDSVRTTSQPPPGSAFSNPTNSFVPKITPPQRPPPSSFGNFHFSDNPLPNIRVEAGQDIVIEDFQLQFNENHFLKTNARDVLRT